MKGQINLNNNPAEQGILRRTLTFVAKIRLRHTLPFPLFRGGGLFLKHLYPELVNRFSAGENSAKAESRTFIENIYNLDAKFHFNTPGISRTQDERTVREIFRKQSEQREGNIRAAEKYGAR